jgi:hypothetical protein
MKKTRRLSILKIFNPKIIKKMIKMNNKRLQKSQNTDHIILSNYL